MNNHTFYMDTYRAAQALTEEDYGMLAILALAGIIAVVKHFRK